MKAETRGPVLSAMNDAVDEPHAPWQSGVAYAVARICCTPVAFGAMRSKCQEELPAGFDWDPTGAPFSKTRTQRLSALAAISTPIAPPDFAYSVPPTSIVPAP